MNDFEGSGQYVDGALASLVHVCANLGMEVGISVIIGGEWLTGIAISGRSWFEQVALLVEQAIPSSNFNLAFRKLGSFVYPAESEIEAGVDYLERQNNLTWYLHLRDARLIHTNSSQVTPGNGGLVRVRLVSVDAWMFGNLGLEGYSPPPPPL